MSESYYLYYGGVDHGPLTMAQIVSRCAAGLVTVDAVFWDEAANAWRPLADLMECGAGAPQLAGLTEADMRGNTGTKRAAPGALAVRDVESARPGPWRRFFAREMDNSLLVFPFWFLLWFLRPDSYRWFGGEYEYVMVCLVLSVPVLALLMVLEPFFLSRYAATPGKWLLGIAVRKKDGNLLSYGDAFRRLLGVIPYGYIPFLNLVTFIFAYNRLREAGVTYWDEKGGYVETCPEKMRWVSFIGICLLYGAMREPFLFHARNAHAVAFQEAMARYEKSRDDFNAGWDAMEAYSISQTPLGYPTPGPELRAAALALDAEVLQDADYQAAVDSQSAGAYPAMLDAARKVAARFPGSGLAQKWLAMGFYWNGKHEEADAAIKEALRIAPGDALAWKDLALIDAYYETPRERWLYYKKSLELDADNPEVLAEAAFMSYIPEYNIQEGTEATDRAMHLLQTTPFNSHHGELREWMAWSNVGFDYAMLRRPADAVTAFEHAVKLAPGNLGVWHDLCKAYLGIGRFADAVPPLERATSLKPGDEESWRWLGYSYMCLGRYAEAVEASQRAVKLAPGDDLAWFTLGKCYLALNQPQDAVNALESATKSGIDHGDDRWALLGKAYEAAGRADDAKAAYQHDTALRDQARTRSRQEALEKYPDLKNGKSLLWQLTSRLAAKAAQPGDANHARYAGREGPMFIADVAAKQLGIAPAARGAR